MLTFFRRIRKSLLATGPVRKYLLYAIGEIALVVIGILIALQINNWNEQRKNVTEENKTIRFIYDELKANRAYHKERITQLIRLENRAKAILSVTGPGANAINGDSILVLLHDYQYNTYYSPLTAKFNQLITGDDLNLISSDSMKFLFNEYNALIVKTAQLSTLLTESSEKIADYFDKKGLTRNVILARVSDKGTEGTYTDKLGWESSLQGTGFSRFGTDMSNILQDPEFESLISRRLRQVIFNKGRIGTVIDNIGLLINFIERHYNLD